MQSLWLDLPPPPPPEGPTIAQPASPVVQPGVVVPAVSAADQEAWLRLIERYQKLRAPKFQGGADPLVADKWKEDVGTILSLRESTEFRGRGWRLSV